MVSGGIESTCFPMRRLNSFTKCVTRTGMSSRRSRSAGSQMGKTFRRQERSPRNCPRDTIFIRSRFVAATSRVARLTRLPHLEQSNFRLTETDFRRLDPYYRYSGKGNIDSRKVGYVMDLSLSAIPTSSGKDTRALQGIGADRCYQGRDVVSLFRRFARLLGIMGQSFRSELSELMARRGPLRSQQILGFGAGIVGKLACGQCNIGLDAKH